MKYYKTHLEVYCFLLAYVFEKLDKRLTVAELAGVLVEPKFQGSDIDSKIYNVFPNLIKKEYFKIYAESPTTSLVKVENYLSGNQKNPDLKRVEEMYYRIMSSSDVALTSYDLGLIFHNVLRNKHDLEICRLFESEFRLKIVISSVWKATMKSYIRDFILDNLIEDRGLDPIVSFEEHLDYLLEHILPSLRSKYLKSLILPVENYFEYDLSSDSVDVRSNTSNGWGFKFRIFELFLCLEEEEVINIGEINCKRVVFECTNDISKSDVLKKLGKSRAQTSHKKSDVAAEFKSYILYKDGRLFEGNNLICKNDRKKNHFTILYHVMKNQKTEHGIKIESMNIKKGNIADYQQKINNKIQKENDEFTRGSYILSIKSKKIRFIPNPRFED